VGPFGEERAGGLFIRILDWMMAPLVILWPAAVLGTYFAALTLADDTYDQRLVDIVHAVSEEVRVLGRDDTGRGSLPVFQALRSDPVDKFFLQFSRADGELLDGDAEIPPAAPADPRPGPEVRFRDVVVDGEKVRMAYQLVTVPAAGRSYVVQVGESLVRRRTLVGDVTTIVMVVIALLVPATVAMVWLGLRQGLAPLLRLREHVERRDPDDLSPIAPDNVPFEIEPLVNTLNRQLERVRLNLEAQRRFVADAAHQMRTPLAGLKTQAQVASGGDSIEEARGRFARIEESADRLGRLMEQLLALARADDALARPKPSQPCEMNALLREACSRAADRALEKDVALAFDAAPAPTHVRGEALLLRELFGNLIDNAIRYTPRGGEVAVELAAGPPVAVAVRDSGSGIAPEERAQVFDRFYRVLGSGESGSGLGLAIVKAIADLHGAQIRVDQGPNGVGALFVVTFPRENPSAGELRVSHL
jgi:two-component system sensor histidine kinase TctE